MSKTRNFSPSRVIAVTWRVLTQIRRDRRTIALMIFIPALIMLIFGFVLGGQTKNLPIMVDNQDAGYTVHAGQNSTSFNFGNEVLSSLQSDDRVKLSQGSFDSGKTGVDNGTYYAAIAFPANFSEVLALRNAGQSIDAPVTVYIDGSNPTIEATVLAALQSSLQNTFGSGGVVLSEQFAFGGIQFSSLDISIPAVISLVLTQTVLLVSLIVIVRETTSGVLSRLYATPLSAFERLLGYSIALLLLGLAMTGIVLFMGLGIFGAIVQGSFALLLLGAVLYASLNIFLAVFLSNFARNELQAVQMVPLITLTSMALSGMLIPVDSFPSWVQTLARFIPMYYANKLFEGIMLKGYGIGNLAQQFTILSGIAALFFVLAVMTVKDKMAD
ncbi:MAG: ABC transporter permease [Candidatus Bathyarchaeia archaeon]